jgi:hypothetical protein
MATILELNPIADEPGRYMVFLYVGTTQYDVGRGTRKECIEDGKAVAEEMGLAVDQISVGDE